MNWRHFPAYLHERFPLVNMALFAILFLTVLAVAQATQPAKPAGFGPQEAVGILATISFFFRLRVFDEIKDYASDLAHFPHRVLQSGRVSLGQLKRVAWAGLVLEAAWSAWVGWGTLLAWALVVGYSLLMRYEFGVREWLRARLVLYAFTHLLIMPLIIGWVWSAYAARPLLSVPLLLLALLSLLGGLSFEIARKIKTPEAERAGVDSYSRTLGYAGAIVAVLVVLLAGVLVQGYLLNLLATRLWPFALMGVLYLVTVGTYLGSLAKPRTKTLKVAELLVSLFMLTSYVSIIVEIAGRLW
ncbi:UbiA prenyltransferase family protein [Hymenobacter latericus]|uniref:UbiA family prenyltransferase n=1 Tax=Hymenobacter sp. YIM 151858-1 TaxID=2987688 RepID=UPI002226EAAE|nr:UbiA family prenyltransferase [Hymenobacter sp. YIM 151858-1]UYZ59481.1 UbiA family prenyltransferase [Hymenobacter sp. YIM 151858-1]